LLEPNPQHGHPSILVLSPTRELAMQIEKEAQKVIGNATWTSQIVVGGTNINTEVRKLQARCDILVAVSSLFPSERQPRHTLLTSGEDPWAPTRSSSKLQSSRQIYPPTLSGSR
jgi:DEAD/DEAH box helicase